MSKTQIYPLTSTGVGGRQQGKYEAWGYDGDSAIIGRYYIQSIFINHPKLSKRAIKVLIDIILECGNQKVGINPIALSLDQIMALDGCDKYQASKTLNELVRAKLLLRISKSVRGKGTMVILNHDLIEGYEQEYLAKIHGK